MGHNKEVSWISVPNRAKQNTANRRWSPRFLKWSESLHINGILRSEIDNLPVLPEMLKTYSLSQLLLNYH